MLTQFNLKTIQLVKGTVDKLRFIKGTRCNLLQIFKKIVHVEILPKRKLSI